MKKLVVFSIVVMISVSVTALAYALYQTGLIGTGPTEKTAEKADPSSEKNLDWMNEIAGYTDDGENTTATSTAEEPSEETAVDESATSTGEIVPSSEQDESATGDDQPALESPQQEEPSDDATATDEPRERGVENLGKADALESTEYDHAFDKLILQAELKKSGVTLSWNATESDAFLEYQVVRSTADANPYAPKTSAVKTISDQSRTIYTDTHVKEGTDYYYRICIAREGKIPACGNILMIRF